jgi:predicted RND superfamily exporter protein
MINLSSKNVRIMDWVLSTIILLIAIYFRSWIVGAIGILGLWAAWYRPASRMANFVKRQKN